MEVQRVEDLLLEEGENNHRCEAVIFIEEIENVGILLIQLDELGGRRVLIRVESSEKEDLSRVVGQSTAHLSHCLDVVGHISEDG